ncbi:MAG: hypothetical protein ACXVAN_06395 [Polyangia bacterium]
MMRQALVALGPKSVVAGVLVGGAALALGALFLPHAAAAPIPGMYRLVLHAPEEPGAFYLSAWVEGDVFVASNAQKSITFVRRGDEHDGCSWMGTEKLTRMNDRVYAYEYAETILSCKPDASPFRKTPRTGVVTVESWSQPATATALSGIQPPGELWNSAMNDVDDEHCDEMDDLEDAQEALADAQREIADAQKEIEEAVAQANEEVKAALEQTDDDD